MSWGRQHMGSKMVDVDERRRVMALFLDFDQKFKPDELIETAKRIARARERAPKCLQDFVVVHGANLVPPYNDEIIVAVEINDWRDDQRYFQELVTLVEEVVGGSFEVVNKRIDHVRAPYNILQRNRNGWTEVI